MTLGSPGTLVGQSEECGDAFYILRRQLLNNLLITHPLMENIDDRCIIDMRYGSPYLGEARDECLECLPGFLPHRVEVSLHAMLLVSASEVCCEPCVGMDLS
jgi:hypothetical protein